MVERKIKDKLVVPVEIPAWGVISAIVVGAFAFGTLYTELKTVVKGLDKLEIVNERQIRNIEVVSQHDRTLQVHEARITALERDRDVTVSKRNQ